MESIERLKILKEIGAEKALELALTQEVRGIDKSYIVCGEKGCHKKIV